jgi:hypothetical protein
LRWSRAIESLMNGVLEDNPMAISMQSKVIRQQGPIAEPVDGELVMADIDRGKYYGLNGIAAAIWQNLEGQTTVEDLCRQLCDAYEVTAEQCSTEVLAFLNELETHNLIIVE